MHPLRRLVPGLLVATLGLAAAGCGGTAAAPAADDSEHSHNGLPAGDGTRAAYVGYALKDVQLPTRPGTPGRYSFRVDYQDEPVTDFLTELTKKMHVYVVRTDLAVFRHLHPTMAADGTWSGNLTLPTSGRYRLVAEFVARDQGGFGDTLVLGSERVIGTPGAKVAVPPATTATTVDGVTLTVVESPTVGVEQQLALGFSTDAGAASPGTYLGVYAHASAFHVGTGVLVHMHPLGPPVTEDGRAVLRFHTGFEVPGSYRMFVQTRLSGVVRTIPITLEVSPRTTPAPAP